MKKPSLSKSYIIFLLFAVGFSVKLYSQPYSCQTIFTADTFAPQYKAAQTCIGTSTTYTQKYALQSAYVPTLADPLITYKIVFHNFMPVNQPGSLNVYTTSSTPSHLSPASFNNIVYGTDGVNGLSNQSDRYSQPRVSSYPGFTVNYINDSRIRYEVVAIYYYQNDTMFNLNLGTQANRQTIANWINDRYPGRMEQGLPIINASGALPNASQWNKRPIVYADLRGDQDSVIHAGYQFANRKTLRHEIGHTFNLWHTYDTEELDCTQPDYLSDVFPSGNGWNCMNKVCPTGGPECAIIAPPCVACYECCAYGTNNLMSENSFTTSNFWISPLQMGRRIRSMHLNTVNGAFGETRFFAKEALSLHSGYWVISNNETWDFDIQLYKDILVKAGATLTIKCKVAMATDGKIKVQKGGKLIIDGGEVTSWCKKTPGYSYHNSPLWSGIEVEGGTSTLQSINANGDSPNQGIVEVINSGTISNAYNGIVSGWSDEWGNWQSSRNGGIVRVNNAYFVNNVYDIIFFKYNKPNSLSKIEDSYFLTTDKIGSYANNTAIAPKEHIKLLGNNGLTIKGCRFENTSSFYSGSDVGIGIYSTDSQFNIDNYCPTCATPLMTEFRNLHVGLWIDNINPLKPVNVKNTLFYKNKQWGAMAENAYYLDMSNNTFIVEQYKTGAYLYKCKYYKFNNNILAGTIRNELGLALFDSKEGAHEVYRNSFIKLQVGVLGLGENAGTTPGALGVKMNCNDFKSGVANNSYDIALPKWNNITPLVYDEQSPVNIPPTFQNATLTVRNLYGATYVNAATKNKWYVDASNTQQINHNFPNTVPATNPNNPNPQASSQIQLNPMSVVFTYSTDCPSTTPSSGSTGTTSTQKLSAMNSYINDLRPETEANLYEIQSTVGAKLNVFLSDSVAEGIDSTIAIFNTNQGNMMDAKVQEIFAYITKADYSKAETTIAGLPSGLSDWKNLLPIILEVEQDSLGAASLLSNPTKLALVESYAATEGKDGQASAQALLRQAYGKIHDYPMALPKEASARTINNLNETTFMQSDSVFVYPNPAQSEVAIYNGLSEAAEYKVTVKDLLGRLIYTNFIGSKQKQIIPIKELGNGVYLLELSKNEKEVVFKTKISKQE